MKQIVVVDVLSVILAALASGWITLSSLSYVSWITMAIKVALVWIAVMVSVNLVFYRYYVLSPIRKAKEKRLRRCSEQ